MTALKILGKQVQCPRCGEAADLLTVTHAATIASVSRRTIYNYIEEGKIGAVKLAGKTYRVCSACLLKIDDMSGMHVRHQNCP